MADNHPETTQELVASVRELREDYDRVLAVNRQLIEQRRYLAGQIHRWHKRTPAGSPAQTSR